METFFDILKFACLAFVAYINFCMYVKVKKFQISAEIIEKYHTESLDEIYQNQEILLKDFAIFHTKVDLYLSTVQLSQEPTQSPTKPIKPNNWDSVREAFKGPVRVEINERN